MSINRRTYTSAVRRTHWSSRHTQTNTAKRTHSDQLEESGDALQ